MSYLPGGRPERLPELAPWGGGGGGGGFIALDAREGGSEARRTAGSRTLLQINVVCVMGIL